MATLPRFVAMETILENIAAKLVEDVQAGDLPMNEPVMECLEALITATRKLQIVREIAEAKEETNAARFRLAC
ncbi:hypothetical protein [Candidatus Magnetaquicoccus inordinatus]|uniref:hypothetical protein n=1 Tax=Candidatus Magnetaquicoccus inordinatus TaxID=2496818 RepID=UPI00102B0965|nr:hypothetical protein [Candidatus Magnetaquicoccus inordinatus]